MNDVPNVPSPPPATIRERVLVDDPADHARAPFDQLLRSPFALLTRLDGPHASRTLVFLFVIALAGHAAYGLVVGSFAGGTQWWAAPLKVTAGTVLCGLLCFPSLYIFVSLSGAETRVRHVLGMLLGVLASTAVLLAGFAPIAWVFSQSSSTVSWLAPLHLLVWFASLLASRRFLDAGLRRWNARRGALVGLWVTVFVATSLQMTTTLRPIVGTSSELLDGRRKFFLQHWAETIAQDSGVARNR